MSTLRGGSGNGEPGRHLGAVPFEKVLVANRGEIAVRVLRTLRRLGIGSVAVYGAADARARHVREADEAVRVPGYLDIDAVIEAARATGAQAIHPGYGFLAENAAFARACGDAGLIFVGPPPEAIEAMGDKIRAKLTVAAAGVPVVPGGGERGLSDGDLVAVALRTGLPVLLKPSAGGGGKGMRLVRDPADLAEAITGARREARGAFGDDALLVERFIDAPRHIEIQVFADAHGGVVHLGERECSLQRRHQKIIEEAPSPLLDEAARGRMGAAAAAAARAVGYVGAGTVEFIVAGAAGAGGAEFYFMEMNTRLQVEHPVTEMAVAVSGLPRLDLVELQLRVAAGEPLPFEQQAVGFAGHAIEARVYAEDPARGFLPTGGRVLTLTEPTDEPALVRVDSGIAPGDEVGSAYDPMLAKVIACGPDREAARRGLDRALASYTLLGVPTNVTFLRAVLAHPDVIAGTLDTGLVERDLASLTRDEIPAEVPAAAALERTHALANDGAGGPWDLPDGWRLSGRAWTSWIITPAGGVPIEVRVRGLAADAEVSIDGGDPVPASLASLDSSTGRAGDGLLAVTYAGRTVRFAWARDGGTLWLGRGGQAWALAEHVWTEASARSAAAADGVVRSPMPGTVLAIKAAEGDAVAEGQPLAIVEAMKMEHTVTAPIAGVVAGLPVRAGTPVALDAVLALIEAAPGASDGPAGEPATGEQREQEG